MILYLKCNQIQRKLQDQKPSIKAEQLAQQLPLLRVTLQHPPPPGSSLYHFYSYILSTKTPPSSSFFTLH